VRSAPWETCRTRNTWSQSARHRPPRRQGCHLGGQAADGLPGIRAAEQLAAEGIEAEVIDPRTLVPLDKELILESVRKTGRLVIVEEDNLRWMAANVAAIRRRRALDWLDAPIKRVSAPDTPPPFAPVMEQFYGAQRTTGDRGGQVSF